ncbi:MAG: choice-of-anchor D domain-containing protein [Myxococcota bacterium]
MRLLVIGLGILGLAACQEYNVESKPDEVEPDPPVVDTDEPPPTPPPPGTPVPDIEISPTSIDFGGLPSECSAAPVTVTVTNVGDADLTINDVFLASGGAEFTQSGAATTLAPGASTQFMVDFYASGTGVFTNEVLVASNDPDESVTGVTLEGEGFAGDLVQEGFNQVGSSVPVDILFVIDNSSSMLDDINALRNNFSTFMQGFIALGLDFQIGVVTTDMENPLESGRIQGPIITTSTPDPVAQFSANADVGTDGSIDEKGLDAVYAALTPPLIQNENAGLIRPGSLLTAIVISDEEDQSSVDANTMINFLDSYQGSPDLSSLSIVGGPRTGILPCWRGIFPASPVPKYWSVAQATGGIHANICQLDMTVILQQLAIVAAGLETDFTLVNVPNDPNSIVVEVDGVVVPNDPNDGWTWVAGTNTVEFHGNGIPEAGTHVTVTYPGGNGACP